jgi:hypothetical protein
VHAARGATLRRRKKASGPLCARDGGEADGEPDKVIDAAMIQAVQIAEKIAPYQHARLSAMKLAGDPNNPVRIKDDATAAELRAEIYRHLGILTANGVLDLEALPPPPKREIAN